MSFFNKVLASVGIGAAKVDTKLQQTSYTVGEEITGIVEITGGNVEQPIDEIYLSLLTTYVRESDDKKYTETGIVKKIKVTETFTIQANEKKEIPFSFELPLDTPISIGRTKIWIHTGLDIKNAVDPTDKDYIKVLPLPIVQSVIQSVEDLGFRLREIECKQAPRTFRGRLPFVQEFEFVPTSGAFRGKLDELELLFSPSTKSKVAILMQVDRRARGLGSLLAEAFDRDETNLRLTISESDIPHLTSKLSEVIKRYS